jgi:hypothetical protein
MHGLKKKMVGSEEFARALFDRADGSLVVVITSDTAPTTLVDTNVRVVEENDRLRVLVELRGDIDSSTTWELLPHSGSRPDDERERTTLERAATPGRARFGHGSQQARRRPGEGRRS